jgi:RNA polymerase sigma-70 factor (ECF subfamily)
VTRTNEPAKPSDAELVSRAQRGDPAAFTELVERYQDRVYNTCYRMCHNHADALDLTQSAFLKALEALPRFEVRATFFTWLFRIAVNLTLSHRRARSRQPVFSLRWSDDDNEGHPLDLPARNDDDDPAEHVARVELQQRIAAALGALDEEFRAAVVLRDVEELDYATIAEILGVPTGTVKSRIYRGRMMLRRLLEQEEPQLGLG